MRVDLTSQPEARELKYENPVSAAGEEGVIRLLMKDPAVADKIPLEEKDFTSPFLAKLFSIIMERIGGGEAVTEAAIAPLLTSAEASHFSKILARPVSAAQADKALVDYIEKIRSAKKTEITDDDALIRFSEKQKKTKSYGG